MGQALGSTSLIPNSADSQYLPWGADPSGGLRNRRYKYSKAAIGFVFTEAWSHSDPLWKRSSPAAGAAGSGPEQAQSQSAGWGVTDKQTDSRGRCSWESNQPKKSVERKEEREREREEEEVELDAEGAGVGL